MLLSVWRRLQHYKIICPGKSCHHIDFLGRGLVTVGTVPSRFMIKELAHSNNANGPIQVGDMAGDFKCDL